VSRRGLDAELVRANSSCVPEKMRQFSAIETLSFWPVQSDRSTRARRERPVEEKVATVEGPLM
jgi:hypothetical protein